MCLRVCVGVRVRVRVAHLQKLEDTIEKQKQAYEDAMQNMEAMKKVRGEWRCSTCCVTLHT